jgi:hypothetical protein
MAEQKNAEHLDYEMLSGIFDDRGMRECGPERIGRYRTVTQATFVSHLPNDHQRAKKICHDCPAQYGCLLYAVRLLNNRELSAGLAGLSVQGTLAGKTAKDISRLKSAGLKTLKQATAQKAQHALDLRKREELLEVPRSETLPLGGGQAGYSAAARRAIFAAQAEAQIGEPAEAVHPVDTSGLNPEEFEVYTRSLDILAQPFDPSNLPPGKDETLL